MQGELVRQGQNRYEVNAYERSSCVMRVKREDSNTMSLVDVEEDSESSRLRLYTDPDGVLVFDLHNVIANAKSRGIAPLLLTVALIDLQMQVIDVVKLSINIKEGVGYDEVFAPNNKDWGYWRTRGHNVILPPNVIIAPEYFPNAPTFANEFGVFVESNYHAIDGEAAWSYTNVGETSALTPVGNQLQLPVEADTLEVVTGKEGSVTKTWRFDKPDPCQDLVVCRWTSLTGVVRQHFFPIVSYIKGNGEQVPLVSAGDGYEVSKSNFTAVRCRLTGLTPYGVWYYLDILQASDLHAIIMPTIAQFRTEIASPMTAAFIDSDGGEAPQGIGFSNFEFTINMRQYGKI